ncbi:MAG: TrkA family potassium uptake protein [Acidimicrobiales bacterium]|nr:TrkA family potassium uptake protein [Acidimicrobiales bacterium]
MLMYIVVAGGGTLGEQVASALEGSGNEVALVEIDPGRAASLARRGLKVVAGDAAVAGVLEAAGALRAEVLVACTGSDQENLVVSLLAKRRLEIPREVARVNDDTNRWLFDGSWGMDAAISQASALVSLIEEATGSARTVRLADLSAVGLVLVEANVTASSAACGRSPAELSFSGHDFLAAVVRQGRPVPVDGRLRFRHGDRALVITDLQGEERVRHAFYPGGVQSPAR